MMRVTEGRCTTPALTDLSGVEHGTVDPNNIAGIHSRVTATDGHGCKNKVSFNCDSVLTGNSRAIFKGYNINKKYRFYERKLNKSQGICRLYTFNNVDFFRMDVTSLSRNIYDLAFIIL